MNKAFKSSDYSEEACRNSSRRSRSNEGETISAKLGDCHSGEWEGLPRSSQTRYEHDGIESLSRRLQGEIFNLQICSWI